MRNSVTSTVLWHNYGWLREFLQHIKWLLSLWWKSVKLRLITGTTVRMLFQWKTGMVHRRHGILWYLHISFDICLLELTQLWLCKWETKNVSGRAAQQYSRYRGIHAVAQDVKSHSCWQCRTFMLIWNSLGLKFNPGTSNAVFEWNFRTQNMCEWPLKLPSSQSCLADE